MARDHLRAMVIKEMAPMTKAQIAVAKGVSFLVLRDRKTGKFTGLSQARAQRLTQADHELVEVWDKVPSTMAYTDLMNRALDKPKEQPQTLKVEGKLTLEQILAESFKPPKPDDPKSDE